MTEASPDEPYTKRKDFICGVVEGIITAVALRRAVRLYISFIWNSVNDLRIIFQDSTAGRGLRNKEKIYFKSK